MLLFGAPDIGKMKAKGDVSGLVKLLKSDKTDLNQAAGRALVEMGPSVVKPMFDAIKKNKKLIITEHWVGYVYKVLENIGTAAVEQLLIALDDESENVSFVACVTLASIGDDRAVKPFLAILNETSFHRMFLRSSVVRYLPDVMGMQAQEPLLAHLEAALKNSALFLDIKAACEALGRIGDEKSIDILIKHGSGNDLQTRVAATESLGKIGGRLQDEKSRARVAEALAGSLRDANPGMRAYAALGLGEIIGHGFTEPLLIALKDKHPLVRSSAARGLRASLDERKVQPLINALSDPEKDVCRNAAEALGIGRDLRAVVPLLALLNDAEVEVRQSAVMTLGLIGDKRALLPLVARLGDRDSQVRSSAAIALNVLGDAGAVVPLMNSLKDHDFTVRVSVVIALDRFSEAQVIETLKAALQDENEFVRNAAAVSLKKIEKNMLKNSITTVSKYTEGLRPLGNKKRLTYTTDEISYGYDVRLLLFRDKQSAEKYYHAFVSYAKNNPPLFLIEIMLLFIPKTIYAEKYAIVIPNEKTDTRPAYNSWAINAIRSGNDTVRVCRSTDHKYKELHNYVDAVFKWDILVPKDFSDTSDEAKELLRDDLNDCFPALKLLGQEGVAVPPEKPNPSGPWIGVLFEISNFEEALYGQAAATLLFEIIGLKGLADSIIHGGDILPECRYWCTAIHTASSQQLEHIEQIMRASNDRHLAPIEFRFLKGSEIPVQILPYQGFVSNNGTYVGV